MTIQITNFMRQMEIEHLVIQQTQISCLILPLELHIKRFENMYYIFIVFRSKLIFFFLRFIEKFNSFPLF